MIASGVIDSVWFMCKFCKICLQDYDRIVHHVESKHQISHGPIDKVDDKAAPVPHSSSRKDTCNKLGKCKMTLRRRHRPTNQQRRSSYRLKLKILKNKKEVGRRNQSEPIKKSSNSSITSRRSHIVPGPLCCEHCGKSFYHKTTYINHMRIHTGDKPFSCKHCGKCFTQVTNVIFHERIHTGEMPYNCKTCGKKFAQIGNLNVHLHKYNHKRGQSERVTYRLA